MTDDLDFLVDDNDGFVGSADNSPAAPHRSKVNTIKQRSGAAPNVFDWIKTFLTPMLFVVLLLTFVFRLINVDGISMMDTLHDSDKVIVTNLFYEPVDGDIVVISHGQQYATPIIKRVVATEGQSVRINYETNQLIVDGVIIDEPYIKEAMVDDPVTFTQEIPEVIPEGKVFVMGDNRNHSLDSRSQKIGLIDKTDIIGKAQFIFLPLNRFGYLY